MKKILSVALAIVMILGCVSVMASALTTNAVLEIFVEPTQANYTKGDIVTFEVSYESSDELGNMGAAFYMQFGFDSSVFEPIEDLSSDKGWSSASTFIYEGYPIENNIKLAYCHAQAFIGESKWTRDAQLNDADKAKGWDSVLQCIQTPDNSCDDDYSTKTAAFAFQLKVKDDANDAGSYAVGVTNWAIENYKCEIDEELGSIAGPSGDDYGFTNSTMFAANDANVTVASAAAPSILEYSKAQIRFKGITATSGASTYEGTFDVRTIAKISEADFLSTFESEANAIAKVSKFGFVYAATSNVAADDFDLETAKAVAQGGKADGYVDKEVTYMQHKAGTDYTFTCLIADIDDADKTDGVSCIAYVCYDGEYIYFDAPVTVSYAGLYSQYMPA